MNIRLKVRVAKTNAYATVKQNGKHKQIRSLIDEKAEENNEQFQNILERVMNDDQSRNIMQR